MREHPANGWPQRSRARRKAELVVLLVARKALEQYADTPFQKPLAAAFQKLTAGLENEIAFNWQDLETTFAFRPISYAKRDLASFQIIASAVRERRELEFDYQKLEAEKSERRRVQPFSLLCVENQWYLRAYDRIRSDLRTFHLARIDNPRMLTRRFERPSGFRCDRSFRGLHRRVWGAGSDRDCPEFSGLGGSRSGGSGF